MNIFISYSSKDRDKVKLLTEDIEALDYTILMDRNSPHTRTETWWNNILDDIRQCDLFIVAVTHSSLTSEFCQHQYRYAYVLHKRILSVVIQQIDTSTLPPELQDAPLIPYTQRSDEQKMALA